MAFVLSESIVALFLVSLSAIWICEGELQLNNEMKHAREEIKFARLAKEASDQYHHQRENNQRTTDGLVVVVNHERIQILQENKVRFTVNKK